MVAFRLDNTIALVLAVGATCVTAQTLPVIDLGTSVHRAQLNVSASLRLRNISVC